MCFRIIKFSPGDGKTVPHFIISLHNWVKFKKYSTRLRTVQLQILVLLQSTIELHLTPNLCCFKTLIFGIILNVTRLIHIPQSEVVHLLRNHFLDNFNPLRNQFNTIQLVCQNYTSEIIWKTPLSLQLITFCVSYERPLSKLVSCS